MVREGCSHEANLSVQLITARLAMEFGREVFGVPGNATQAVSFAPNLLIKQGAKGPVRVTLTQLEQPAAEQRNLLVAESLSGSGQKIYAPAELGRAAAD